MNITAIEERFDKDIRRYEQQKKRRKRKQWSRVRIEGKKIALRKPRFDKELRVI